MSGVFDKVKNSSDMGIKDFHDEFYSKADSLWKAENIDYSGEHHDVYAKDVQMYDFETGQHTEEFLEKSHEEGFDWSPDMGNLRKQHYENLIQDVHSKGVERLENPTYGHNFQLDLKTDFKELWELDNAGKMFVKADGTPISPYKLHRLLKENIYPEKLKEIVGDGRVMLTDESKALDATLDALNHSLELENLKIVDKPGPPKK